MQPEFWEFLEQLIASSEIVIDRPAGSRHPRFAEIVYPFDYGYLAGTSSADGDGMDVWRGSLAEKTLGAILVTVDLRKRDSEIKLLLGCTPQEIAAILDFHNKGEMRAELVLRPATTKEKT
jgi:inorganic pyrophosphatase